MDHFANRGGSWNNTQILEKKKYTNTQIHKYTNTQILMVHFANRGFWNIQSEDQDYYTANSGCSG